VETALPPFRKYLFVCENERPEGDCCGESGKAVREDLKRLVKEKGLASKIRVSRSGCVDTCMEGPNVLLFPDRLWFKRVKATDLEEIVRRASEDL